jgi:hypothetical protein
MKRASKQGATVTETLRELIQHSGETLYRVAKDAGVPYPTLHRFMAGKRSVSGLTIDRLCASLGLRLTGRDLKTKE